MPVRNIIMNALTILAVMVPFVAGQINQLESECNILQSLDDLQTRLTREETRTDTEIAGLKQSSITATTELANLKESLSSVEALSNSEIANLKESMNSAKAQIATLRESLTAAETEIANLKGAETGPTGIECPDAWTVFQGSCYLSHHTLYDFHNAEAKCRELGGRLIHIETATENAFIKSFVAEFKADDHWIGLEDDVTEGVWKWHGTDTVTNFTNWAITQPNDGTGANCVAIWAYFEYNWVDEPCTGRAFRPLCERR